MVRLGFNHVDLATMDMAATKDFYTNILGFPVVRSDIIERETGGYAEHVFFDAGGGQMIAFAGLEHLKEGVPENLDTGINRGLGVRDGVYHFAFEAGSEDAHGRALWCLGKAVAYLDDPGHLAMSTTLFKKALRVAEDFRSPRAIAFCLVGLHAYLHTFSGDSDVRRILEVLAERLFKQFENHGTDDWPWLENAVNYANGKLPHALLICGHRMQRDDMTDMGLGVLKWLLSIQTEDKHFVPIGSNGWYERSGPRARFDQQPVETKDMVEACIEAFKITRDQVWFEGAVMCFNWFLGHNDLNMSLYDPKTGGCRDGLMADGINQNQGAESTLAWLLSLMTLQKLYADAILNQWPSQKTN